MDSDPEISRNPVAPDTTSQLLDGQLHNEPYNQLFGARQRLETALARYGKLFNGTAVGHIILNEADIIVDANPETAQIVGVQQHDLVGRVFGELVRPEDRTALSSCLSAIRGGISEEPFTVDLLRPDGEVVHTAFIGITDRQHDNGPFVHATLIDVSDQQEVEDDLRLVRDQIERHEQSERRLGWYQEKLRSVASQLTLTEERERRRIATLLHDRISQNLVSANMLLGVLLDARLSQEQTLQIGDVRHSIIEVIRNTRDLIQELSPPVLHEQSLDTAIEWVAEHFSRTYGLRVTVSGSVDDSTLTEDGRVVLFRGAQELLTNCYRHSAAKQVSLLLRQRNGELRITVEDHGVGFDSENREKHRGIGLFLLRERLQSLGGTIEIKSGPGTGTRVTIGVPTASLNQRLASQHLRGDTHGTLKEFPTDLTGAKPVNAHGHRNQNTSGPETTL